MKTLYIGIGLLFFIQGTEGFTIKAETALRNELFTTNNYDVNVRPLSRVTVSVQFNLLTIHELNIRDQIFKVSGWFTLSWKDKRLEWNETANGDVRFLFATEQEVWRPALIVSNSVDNLGVIQDEFTPFRITNEGRLIWEPSRIFSVNCEVDITFYPFDSQECFITLQSWSYNLREVNLTQFGDGINLDDFRPNGEWDLKSNRITTEDATDSKGDSFSLIKFHFKLDRKSQYYWLNVLLPIIVNSILTALVFALPAESGEKMGYSLTVLLSFVVLLTLVADNIPSTSINTSLIVVYFAVVLILGAGAVFLSILVLELYFRSDLQPIPKWLMFITRDVIGRIVCYKSCRKGLKKSKVENGVEPQVDYELSNPNRRATTIKRENFMRQSSELYQEQQMDGELRWRDIAQIWDIFFLRLYVIIISFVTIGFLSSAVTRCC